MAETPDPTDRPSIIEKLTGQTAKLTVFVTALVSLTTFVLTNIPTLVDGWNNARCSIWDCTDPPQSAPTETKTTDATNLPAPPDHDNVSAKTPDTPSPTNPGSVAPTEGRIGATEGTVRAAFLLQARTV